MPKSRGYSHSPAPSQSGAMSQIGHGGVNPFATLPTPGYGSGRNTPLGGYDSHTHSPLRGSLAEFGSLAQPVPSSRPPTNYLGDFQLPTTRSPDNVAGGPSDADLDHAVQDMLRHADLNSVTKREIRRKLEEQFGRDLSSRKNTINASIDRALVTFSN